MSLSENIKILKCYFRRTSVVTPLEQKILPYLDLTFCLSGEMHYKLNGEDIVLSSGDAIFFPPGSTRERLFSEEPCHYVIINAYIGNDDELQLCSFIPKCVNSNTIFLLETLVRDFGTVSSKKTEKCETLLAYLYYQLLERSCEGENPHIQHIKQYITDNISKGLSLNDIASSVHLAPQYACLLFKKHTGITITQFIINQRIDLAKRLIITEDKTLYKIAELCGFHDYNYFSKTFKKVTGLSAAQYRKTKYENI